MADEKKILNEKVESNENNLGKKLKVFLVDDDRFLLDMYSIKFKSKGLDIETFSGSQAILQKLREGSVPDIIILDIIMPTMDGLEMLEVMRKENLAKDSVVVMLTNQPDEVDRAKALGVDGYIVKATTIPSGVVEEVLNIYNKKKKNGNRI